MSRNWNGRAVALAAGVALTAAAPMAARAEVAGGVIGCDASGNKQIAGAIIGGVLGGVAGNNIIKKDQQAGTIVGATAGAATGSYVGCQMQKKDADRAYAPTRETVVVREPAPRETIVVREPPPRETIVVREPPPRTVVYESAPPPPPRTVVYEEAPPPPPRTVVVRERYDDAPPPPPRSVVARERYDDDDYYVYERRKGHKHYRDRRWARDAYYLPPGQAKRYLIGQRMPVTYVRREYMIVEPARYRLRPAPVGYSWVMYGGDAYLVGTQTGMIAQIVRAVLG